MNPEVHDNLSHAVVLGQTQGRTGQSRSQKVTAVRTNTENVRTSEESGRSFSCKAAGGHSKILYSILKGKRQGLSKNIKLLMSCVSVLDAKERSKRGYGCPGCSVLQ